MQRVASTSFEDYDIRITPIRWPTMRKRDPRKMLAYMEMRVRRVIDLFGANNKEYHEQCEAARAWLDDYIDTLEKDDPQRARLGVLLDIWGKFGIDPDFCDVHVEYTIT